MQSSTRSQTATIAQVRNKNFTVSVFGKISSNVNVLTLQGETVRNIIMFWGFENPSTFMMFFKTSFSGNLKI